MLGFVYLFVSELPLELKSELPLELKSMSVFVYLFVSE